MDVIKWLTSLLSEELNTCQMICSSISGMSGKCVRRGNKEKYCPIWFSVGKCIIFLITNIYLLIHLHICVISRANGKEVEVSLLPQPCWHHPPLFLPADSSGPHHKATCKWCHSAAKSLPAWACHTNDWPRFYGILLHAASEGPCWCCWAPQCWGCPGTPGKCTARSCPGSRGWWSLGMEGWKCSHLSPLSTTLCLGGHWRSDSAMSCCLQSFFQQEVIPVQGNIIPRH